MGSPPAVCPTVVKIVLDLFPDELEDGAEVVLVMGYCCGSA